MTHKSLRAENAELRLRLEEAEETIRAIQHGAIDAIVVGEADGHRVYTLESVDRPYRLFVEQMQQGAATLQADGTLVYCNRQLATLLGVAAEKLVGAMLGDFVVAQDRSVYEQLRRRAATRDGQGEVRLKHPDEQSVPAYLTFSELPKECGSLTGVLVTDLTTQKRHQQLTLAHHALRASEARFREMADTAPAMLWVTDADGACTFLSRGWYAYTGQTDEEGAGQGWLNAVHPDDREAAAAAFLAANERRAPFSIDYRVRRADGEYRWAIDAGQPRRDAEDNFLGYVGSVFDVQDRKLYEELLQESEERSRMLAEHMAQLAWICDELGNATWYNQRWLDYTGCSLEEMRADGWLKVHHPDYVDRVVKSIEQARATGRIWEDTFPLRGKDGEYRWFLSRAVPIRDEGGAIRRWFGTNTDVTELIRMEEALKEGDRRKDEFLAVLAHELRNPLAPIRNALSILRITAREDAAVDDISGLLERQVNHMVRLVDDLLEVSRITRGNIELRTEPVDVAAVMRSALETSRPLLDAAEHELTFAVPSEALILDGDPVRLAQVLANLLNNAAKYTEPKGRIWFSAAREAGCAAIRVRDSGMGIATDMLPRVFDLFAQVDGRADRAQGGLGIGLALVKSLVEMHGGSVAAHSAGIGRGSEFVVRLPLSTALAAPGTTTAADSTPAIAHRRFLVVDDNRDAADSLGTLLELMGADVRVAYGGTEALAAYAAYRPAVVMLDIGMPQMDGHEVARRIRAMPDGAGVRLVALTGWGQDEDRRRSEEAGFDAHVVKPVDVPALLRLIAALDTG